MPDAPKHQVPLFVEHQDDTRIVRKANDKIGYKVKSRHLALLSRKILNVLVWCAQDKHRSREWDSLQLFCAILGNRNIFGHGFHQTTVVFLAMIGAQDQSGKTT